MTAEPLAIISARLLAMPPDKLRRLDRALAGVPRDGNTSFGDWLPKARPEFSWGYRHFQHMRGALDRVTARQVKRVYFSVPIRHGKSEHNTIAYAGYRLERDPHTRILICSYNQRQAEKFSREICRLVKRRGVPLSVEKDGASEWETAAGGGVKAFGSGSGVASVNADLIILDDPIGSRDDAESAAERDRVWDWITNDLLARCEPHTAVLFTGSRWHTDDPGGRIIDGQAGQWEVVDLPAEAEENDPLGRAVGEPLWPELRGKEWLEEKRKELGAYGFASLLQGRPRPRGGGMFRWDWWKLTDSVPADGRLIRYWDLAGTEADGGDPDWTVGALLCREPSRKGENGKVVSGRTFVVDVARFRHSVGQRDAEMERVAKADAKRYEGRELSWWLEKEAGIGGKDRTTELVRRIQGAGVGVRTEAATQNKVIRAEPLASAVEAGNVYLCPGSWRDDLRRECGEFPTGKHDDITDALSGGYNKLSVSGPLFGTPVEV